jgi:hypothetical protein
VRHAHEHGLDCTSTRYQRAAGRYADITTLKAANELGMQYTIQSMLGAAYCDKLAVVLCLHAEGCPWSRSVFDVAAGRGNTAMCEYLYAENCPWHESTCNEAARNGHGSLLRWLHERRCPWDSNSITTAAAKGGSVEALGYVLQRRLGYSKHHIRRRKTEMLNIAGAHNKLAAARWLRQQGAQWPARLCWNGQQWSDDTLAWARAKYCTSPIS